MPQRADILQQDQVRSMLEINYKKEKKMLIEKLKDRDLSLGTILIIIAVLVWIIPVKLVLSILGIYGLVQIFWKKEEKVIEKHSHHHHHNGGQKKKVTRKKNG